MGTKQIMSHLKVILGDDIDANIATYITSMKHEEDYEEFMENIVNKTKSDHVNAYHAIKYIIFGNKLRPKGSKASNIANTSNPPQKNQNPTHINQTPLQKNQNLPQKNQNPPQKVKEVQAPSQGKKGKKKFRDIREYQEQKKEKQGRHACDCMGQEHEFLNNCLYCGRIHCFQEGPGPCLCCGNEITVRGEIQNAANAKPLVKHKLNKVFDDDNDYFKINAKKASEDKRKMVVALDFASRKVIESSQEDVKLKELLLKDTMEHLNRVQELYKKLQKESEYKASAALAKQNKSTNDLVDLLVQMRHKKPKEKEDLGEETSSMPILKYNTNILDEDLLLATDQGLCLSMHQPYASLLVAGVKMDEGRVWPTTHRGRLWIAAAAKQPDEEEILALENHYREFYKDPMLKFPKEYPTSCLLGCVTVEDCLDQETYKKTYGREAGSPYMLICSNPIILPVFYPISGKHKIYPLDKEVHKCAKIALQYAEYV